MFDDLKSTPAQAQCHLLMSHKMMTQRAEKSEGDCLIVQFLPLPTVVINEYMCKIKFHRGLDGYYNKKISVVAIPLPYCQK